MTTSHYIWIYGLAEALALVLIVTIVLGIQWWRLRKERRSWLTLAERVDRLITDEIIRARDTHTKRPELRDGWIATLHALSKPFRHERLAEDEVWHEVVGAIDRCFEGLARTTASPRVQSARQPETTPAPIQDVGLDSPGMESDIEALLQDYQQGRTTLSENQSNGGDLKIKYQDLKLVSDGLLDRIQAIGPGSEVDMLVLRQELDVFMQSNLAFMQAAYNAERNLNFLEQQFDDFEGRIHNLQVTVNNYRKSVHKLVTERDLLIEEKQQYIAQLELKDKVVARLNRNYETLRREYTKIYGG
jgi:hypothetical protein